jgi:excisionase family DNA binding protein
MKDELLSTKEAAEMLGLAQETISRLIRKEKLEGYKLGSFYVVVRSSVETYAATVNGKAKNDPTRKLEIAHGQFNLPPGYDSGR